MSTLLEQASLVLIPSGYKEDVVYSQIPTSGAGDLSFTRASNGTRINSAGLVEVCPWNLVQNSEDLSAGWTLAAATIGANATTAPNGTSTADSFTSSATLANHVAYQLLTGVSGAYTFSAYVKKANSRYVYIKLVGDASQWVAAVFDLNDGTLTKSEATGWTGLSASSQSVGDGWYKLIVSGSGATSVDFNVGIQYTNTGTPTFSAYADASFAGTGTIDYYIWGAQLNIGSTAKPYFPTTDRLNVPRLTYQNGGGGCPSLLLEKQSTNELSYSEEFENSAYTKSNASISANATTSPDGTQNADKLIEDNTNNGHVIFRTPSGNSKTLSFYAKAAERTWISVLSNNGNNTFFNLGDGTLGTVAATSSATITAVGNGWYRCTVYNTHPTYGFSIYLATGNNVVEYTGNGTSGVYIWGAQLEASSYPTSYIPTTSSSATRVADACYKTGISSLIGQTEGVLFADLVFLNPEPMFFLSIVGTDWYQDSIYFELANSTNYISVASVKSSTGAGSANSTIAPTANSRYKIAVQYSGTAFNLYINGTKFSGTRSANSLCSKLYLNELGTLASTKNNLQTKFNEVVTFTTALSDAECISLTTI